MLNFCPVFYDNNVSAPVQFVFYINAEILF